jgi:hypothetical protein
MHLAISYTICIFYGASVLSWSGSPLYRGFTLTLKHTTIVRTSMEVWLARHRNLWQNTTLEETSGSSVGFEPTNPASEQPQTKALGRAATGIGYAMCAGTQYTQQSHNFLWALYKRQGENEWYFEKTMAKSHEKHHEVDLRVFRGQSELFTPKQLFLL